MPLSYKNGNLLTDPEVNVIAHQANLFHTFGAGIAKAIREDYPVAYEADCQTGKGDKNKLGTYSTAVDENGKIFINCYSQTGMGASPENTSYDCIFKIFSVLESKLRKHNEKVNVLPKVLGVPYGYGSALAGGRWTIVQAIFKAIFEDSPVDCIIVKLPTQQDLK